MLPRPHLHPCRTCASGCSCGNLSLSAGGGSGPGWRALPGPPNTRQAGTLTQNFGNLPAELVQTAVLWELCLGRDPDVRWGGVGWGDIVLCQ